MAIGAHRAARGNGTMGSRTARIIGIVGIVWNLMGVASYLAHVGLFGAPPAPPPGAPAMPAAITAAFAIAVFAGVAGSIGLALLARWAAPVLWLSFVASVIDWGWVFAYGRDSAWLGVAVIGGAMVLAVVASRMGRGRIATPSGSV